MSEDDVQRVLEQADELLARARPTEALRCLDGLAAAALGDDQRVEYVALRALALADLCQYDDALEAVDALIHTHPAAARLHAARGVVLSAAGDLESAREALETAGSLDGDDEVVLANLALIYERLLEPEKALRLYDRLIEQGVDLDWLLLRRAAVQADAGNTTEAKATLRRYLSLAPDDVSAWVTLAILHSDDEEFDQAFRCYRSAEQVAPDSALLRFNWGVSAVRAGRAEEAETQLAYLRRVEVDGARPRLLKAFLLEESGDVAEATRGYDDALRHARPDDREELTYTLEMAMDFFARQKWRRRCETLLTRAYAANACTAELCELFRELTGKPLRRASWFSVLVEADYRRGLIEVVRRGTDKAGPFNRFLRAYQVVAADRDDAVATALEFARRMGETGAIVREMAEEPIEDDFTGIYEVEERAVVFHADARGPG
jgi:Flp pilus assembly protein TadD